MATISSDPPKRSFADIAASVATQDSSGPSASRSTMQSKGHSAANTTSLANKPTESPPEQASSARSSKPVHAWSDEELTEEFAKLLKDHPDALPGDLAPSSGNVWPAKLEPGKTIASSKNLRQGHKSTENPSGPSVSQSTMQSKNRLPANSASPAGKHTQSLSPPVSSSQSPGSSMHAASGEDLTKDLAKIAARKSEGADQGGAGAQNVSSSAAVRSLVLSRASGSDDSQKADSSSDLGTKPPSLDGKSITSGTTFALDEKESLRPDDSASVKAAAEDDDSFSIRGSLIAGSRMSSDFAARARGIQLGDMPERQLVQPAVEAHGQGILTPQSTSSEQPAQNPLRSTGGSSDALNVIYRQAPDDKLLEALAAPRDRLFLLRLEKDVIDFVQDSKEPYIDLPPSNSFCRMLTHKLADYYHMTHSYERNLGAVRIFRTPFCRVPPSLATMVPQTTVVVSSTPPPAVLPRKIMRRGQDEEGGAASTGASKATSEIGSESKDKQPLAAQKLSREEREEIYKVVRQRIFGSTEDTTSEVDGEAGISRTSSVSANRSSTSKKGKTPVKQRRDDDADGFDSRRQYTPYWGSQQQTWVSQAPNQYIPQASAQFTPQPAPSYPAQVAPMYGQQPGYPAVQGMASNAAPQYQVPPQYAPQPVQQRYPPNASPMTAYGSPILPGAPPSQNWQPGFSPAPYPPRGPTPNGPHSQNGIPYPFGQLPANTNPHDPKSQHPIPGSYNRNHAFNPKTQSFVPGSNGMPPPPMQPPHPPFTAPGSHHSSPQIGTPHLAYGGYPPAMPPHPYAGGYNMARQGSNSSIAAYHTPPTLVAHHVQQMPPMQSLPHIPPPQHLPLGQQAHALGRANIPQGPNQMFSSSHLPTYGNPASLPQKPATGI
ncbi:R3H domain-containing protein 2 [Trichoderma ghanense]|uniref:R3H domain-containing protein 2 n=1 Tax=Trichoderma ghanense TaxID=65468 RepID=A0ABY2H8F5_9HYPO